MVGRKNKLRIGPDGNETPIEHRHRGCTPPAVPSPARPQLHEGRVPSPKHEAQAFPSPTRRFASLVEGEDKVDDGVKASEDTIARCGPRPETL